MTKLLYENFKFAFCLKNVGWMICGSINCYLWNIILIIYFNVIKLIC